MKTVVGANNFVVNCTSRSLGVPCGEICGELSTDYSSGQSQSGAHGSWAPFQGGTGGHVPPPTFFEVGDNIPFVPPWFGEKSN